MTNLAVPSQRTWTTGETVSAAELNANVRDAVNFLINAPLFRGHQATAQSIPANTWTKVQIDTADWDTASGWASGTNTRYTAQVAGKYDASGLAAFAANATGDRFAVITVNGATPGSVYFGGATSPVNTHAVGKQFTDTFDLAVGDYLSLWAWQASGAALNLMAGSFLNARWVAS